MCAHPSYSGELTPGASAPAQIGHAVFSPNSKFILSASFDSRLRLWDYAAGTCVKTYKGHFNERYCVTAGFAIDPSDPSKRLVVSGNEQSTDASLWNLNSRAPLPPLRGARELAEDGGVEPPQVLGVEGHVSRPLIATCGVGAYGEVVFGARNA